jgi:hypothetical protein
MTTIRNAGKEKYFNSLEKYHMFLISKEGIHINEFNNNSIFESTYQKLKKYPIDSRT